MYDHHVHACTTLKEIINQIANSDFMLVGLMREIDGLCNRDDACDLRGFCRDDLDNRLDIYFFPLPLIAIIELITHCNSIQECFKSNQLQ